MFLWREQREFSFFVRKTRPSIGGSKWALTAKICSERIRKQKKRKRENEFKVYCKDKVKEIKVNVVIINNKIMAPLLYVLI